ncbi:hypothetical protein [Methanobrevibacter sp.]|uniref:hypothetical protein n=1 Tax=Methanobrevibacter sp. TaxID=66852 RepID=UPI003D7EA479
MYINLDSIFPFYLVTDGEKTIIERKIDELLNKYDGDIYIYEAFQEYAFLLKSFLNHDMESYNRVHVISEIDHMGDLTKTLFIECWDKGIREEFDQKKYLMDLATKNTCRYFNQIQFENDKVIKIAKTEDAIKLQKIENDFYDRYSNIPCLCGKQGYDENKHELILNLVNGTTAQDWYYKNGDFKKLISNVIKALHTINDTDIDIEDNDEDIRKAFYNELITKVSTRVNPCKKLIDYFIKETEVNCIDHMPITPDFNILMDALNKWYENNEINFNACLCHGDPNTDNTMIDKDDNVIFIDPRGYFGKLKTIGLGMAEYDIAKFCYGLNGYSRFNSAPYIEIDELEYSDSDGLNFKIKYPTGDNSSITQIDLDDMPIDTNIKIIVGIIWMKLTSYIINDPMKSVIAYLYGNAICTKYLKELKYLK